MRAELKLLKELGDLRDGILLAGALVYVAGYVVWSINSLRNNLGLLPALKFQYFFAGSFPVAIALLVYGAVHGIRAFLGAISKWIEKELVRKRAALLLQLLFALAVIVFLSLEWTMEERWITVGLLVSVACAGVSLALVGERFYKFVVVVVAPVTGGLLGLVVYVLSVYPELPQEFGGVKPRCVQLDLTRASLSQATAEALVPKASDEIGRSYRVSVYFVGNDELILKLRHRGKAFGRTFRVDNAAVQAVVGC
jgi:hypothetical protein